MDEVASLTFADDEVRTAVDLRSYRLVAVKKAAYVVAELCTAILGTPEGDRIPVTFRFPPGTSQALALDGVRRFFQEALDQELRESVAAETAPLRALILAQAFSKTDLVRRG